MYFCNSLLLNFIERVAIVQQYPYTVIHYIQRDMKNLISEIFLFGGLPVEVIGEIGEFCSQASFAKGDHLFNEGESASAFYYIVSGKVKIFNVSAQGQEQIFEILGKNNLIAEAAIFDKETYPAYCQALEKTVTVRIPRIEFLNLIENRPGVALKIMHAYSKRLRYFVGLVEKLSLQDIKSRLARYFIENSGDVNGKQTCEIPVTKKELAALLGTIPETLSRTLRSLKDLGLIEEEGSSIIILNTKALRKLI